MNVGQRSSMSIGINFDARCNARCAHCCVSSSPNAKAQLPEAVLDQKVSEALELPEIREIGFTGGEVMLRRDLCLRLIRRIAQSGRSVTIVTNGFWAVSKKIADLRVAELKDSGISAVTVSYDDFHAPYIKAERIQHALNSLKQANVDVVLNMAVSNSHDSLDLLKTLGNSTLGIQVTRFPMLPAGEATKFPDSEYDRHPLDENDLRCPGYELILHHDGYVYPCCSPVVFDTQLRLGRVEDATIEEHIDSIERNLLLAIIRNEGFGWFIDKLRERGADRQIGLDLTNVVSACEVCLRLFKSSEVVEVLRDEIIAYDLNSPRSPSMHA